MTQEAQDELKQLNQESEKLYERSNYYRRQNLKYEARSYEQKWVRIQDKIREIEKTGLSSSEQYAIKKSLPGFFIIKSTKELGSSSYEAVGFVPKLNNYFVVNYMKFSSFMRNVRGMASEAGKTNINSIRVISKDIYDEITKGVQEKGRKHEIFFMGSYQEKRGGVIQEKRKSGFDSNTPINF